MGDSIDMNIAEQKWALRRDIKKWRSELSDTIYDKVCGQIEARVKNLEELQEAEIIHCYVSMDERREINTRPLINHFLNLGKTVVVPRMLEKGRLAHHVISSADELTVNEWGVAEPNPTLHDEIKPDNLDAIIVPLSAADLDCQRLGYGKGFYDRFLSQVKVPTIGLCYDEWLVESLPTDEYDVPLDVIVTEQQIYRCN